MGRDIRIDTKSLEAFRDQIQEMEQQAVNEFFESLAKEIAARLLAKVIKRTPVGDYSGDIKTYKRANKKKGIQKGDVMKTKTGKLRYEKYKTVGFQTKSGKSVSFRANINKTGGTLRRGWTAGSDQNAKAFADSLVMKKHGNLYEVTVANNVEYASYVEFGHRTRGGSGFVTGKFMLTLSEHELKGQLPRIIKRKMDAWLAGLGGS